MDKEAILVLSTKDLRVIVRSTNPTGKYRVEYETAKAELERRVAAAKNADHVDGYDRDDLGESPDY